MKVLKTEELPYWVSIFFSFLVWGSLVVVTPIFFLVNLLFLFPIALITDRGRLLITHKSAVWWAKAVIAGSPIWKLKVTGKSNIEPNKSYVIISNHQSMLDILATCAAIPLNFKFLAKKELFLIPFMGWAMLLSGYVPVDRSSKESGRKAIKRITQLLKKDVSILFFPEGTRSPDGKMKKFKMGAFKLARDANMEILPVVIDGTGRALPKKSIRLFKKTVFKVTIGKPTSLADVSDSELEIEREKIWTDMKTKLARKV